MRLQRFTGDAKLMVRHLTSRSLDHGTAAGDPPPATAAVPAVLSPVVSAQPGVDLAAPARDLDVASDDEDGGAPRRRHGIPPPAVGPDGLAAPTDTPLTLWPVPSVCPSVSHAPVGQLVMPGQAVGVFPGPDPGPLAAADVPTLLGV
jgi:hypothetical protein